VPANLTLMPEEDSVALTRICCQILSAAHREEASWRVTEHLELDYCTLAVSSQVLICPELV
jgi:hypothetical protein